MKILFSFLFCLAILSYNAQILNQVGSSIKNGATTKAADFNRTRSNKEKNDLNNKNTPPRSGEQDPTEENATEDLNEENPEPTPNEGNYVKMDFTYLFTYLLSYETVNYPEDSESTTKEMSYFFGDSCSLFSTDDAFLLNDLRHKLTLILNEGSKTGFSTAYLATSAEAIGDMNREIYAYKKTGKVKNILGYTCEEYTLMRENSIISSLWSAKENPLIQSKLNPAFLNDQMIMGINSMNPDPNGFIMEFNQYGEGERLINSVRVSHFEKTEKIIQLGEYQITSY